MSKILQKPSSEAPIVEKTDWVRKLNQGHSEFFCSPDEEQRRKLYRVEHPTEICAFKCMDGRIHIPILTDTPLGIVQPFRNLGGYFDLGWPYLGQSFENWVNYAISKNRKCLVMVTYHFSAGNNEHRGCAGFDYNKGAAYAFTVSFKKQIETIFGLGHVAVYPIIVGLETDTDALIFHGEKDGVLDLGQIDPLISRDELQKRLSEMYPDMGDQMIDDLLPLIFGNLKHMAEVKASNRLVVDSEHREFIVGIGRGFDWLHEPNVALLIGPYSPDLYQPIKKAFDIIQHNMEAHRINDDGFIVLTSAPFRRNLGVDRLRAIAKTKFLTDLAKDVIVKRFPDLQNKMHSMSVIIDLNTRKIEEV